MAHLREIVRQKCTCGKYATVILYNKFNAACGNYCKRCGNVALEKLVGKKTKNIS